MNFAKVITGAALVFSIWSCADKHTSSILVERGVPVYERDYLVTKEGYGIDSRLKKVFMDGYIEEGMYQNMVFHLWGPPDRSFDDDKIWEYVTNEGGLITRVKFKKSEKLRLGLRELVVDVIEGDRYGGSLAPGAKPQD